MVVSLWKAVLAFIAPGLNGKGLLEMHLIVLESRGFCALAFFTPGNFVLFQGVGCYVQLQPVLRAVKNHF